MGECRFWFSFLFFFTCFSNARWKIPTRRVGVRVDHPFPWFWQLLAFVSAMEVVLDVCFYLRASFDLSLILEFYLFPSTRFPFACMPMRVFVCYFLQTALNNCKLCIQMQFIFDLKNEKENKITNSARKTDSIFKHDCKRISTNCFYSWYRINASPPASKCCDEFLIFCRKRKEKFAIYKLRKSFLLEWRVIALSYSVGIF